MRWKVQKIQASACRKNGETGNSRHEQAAASFIGGKACFDGPRQAQPYIHKNDSMAKKQDVAQAAAKAEQAG